jgi:hypothetical protein
VIVIDKLGNVATTTIRVAHMRTTRRHHRHHRAHRARRPRLRATHGAHRGNAPRCVGWWSNPVEGNTLWGPGSTVGRCAR